MGKKDGKSNGVRKGTIEIDGWTVSECDSGPSKKMAKLSPWIETEAEADSITKSSTPKFSNEKLIKNFRESFIKKSSFSSEGLKLTNDPFQVAVLDKLLEDESEIPNLITEMEALEWTRKQMDLYEFYQSTDLANIQSPHLAKFYNFFNNDVKNWMEKLSGLKFMKISASCSMYNCGDFLLTHDDLLSDRLIAFVFYLSPWDGKENWNESMGGELELFATDLDGQPKFPAVRKISPANNQFVFFKVEKKSYHQVGEVLTKDYPRLTINGWFHGFKDNPDFDSDAIKVKKPNVPIFKSPIDVSLKLSDFIFKMYLKDSIKTSVQHQIEENSEAALGEFLENEFHTKVMKELESGGLKWIRKGPTNQQNYEIVNADGLQSGSSLKKLLDLMSSKPMFQLLHEYTELDLHGKNSKKPKCTVEMQRWKGGCYTLIGDPSTYNNDTLDLILYFGSNENVGTITYLTPEDDQVENSSEISSEIENEPVLLTIYPQNNFLNIIYRSSGTANFTKYCSKSSNMDTEFNYILFCSYKE